ARLQPATQQGLRRGFKVGVCLNQKTNRIELRLPGLKLPDGEPPALTLRCASPQTRQRLHLLVLGGSGGDQAALRTAVLEALHPSKVDGDEFRTGAFEAGRLYGPLP